MSIWRTIDLLDKKRPGEFKGQILMLAIDDDSRPVYPYVPLRWHPHQGWLTTNDPQVWAQYAAGEVGRFFQELRSEDPKEKGE